MRTGESAQGRFRGSNRPNAPRPATAPLQPAPTPAGPAPIWPRPSQAPPPAPPRTINPGCTGPAPQAPAPPLRPRPRLASGYKVPSRRRHSLERWPGAPGARLEPRSLVARFPLAGGRPPRRARACDWPAAGCGWRQARCHGGAPGAAGTSLACTGDSGGAARAAAAEEVRRPGSRAAVGGQAGSGSGRRSPDPRLPPAGPARLAPQRARDAVSGRPGVPSVP